MNRRDFLSHTAAALTVGALLPRSASAQTYQKADGQNYAPMGKPHPVVKPGEFVIAAAHLEHGHVYGMCQGLIEAGAVLRWVYDPDSKKTDAFVKKYPGTKVAQSIDEIYADKDVKMVCAAHVTSLRADFGISVMETGRDYFTDKAPCTTLEQLERVKQTVAKTGRKFFVYFGERIHNESAMYATDLLEHDVIGKVVQVVNLAPHRLSKPTRPDWFWVREKFGGILCDIGSHQFEQFLAYTKATEAIVTQSAVGNFANQDHPEFEDFGEASLIGDTGASNYVRVDWFTADGLSTWGDGRTFILGTKGTIELRKYVDVARDDTGSHVYLVDGKGEHRFDVDGKVGYRFFGECILDCLNRTEKAMTQAHIFKAAEIGVRAQESARRLTGALS